MADVHVHVVSRTIQPAIATSYDFTVSGGLANIKAYIVIVGSTNEADTGGWRQDSLLSIGFGINGSSTLSAMGVAGEDNLATTDTGRTYLNNYIVVAPNPTNPSGYGLYWNKTDIANGVRLNRSNYNSACGTYVKVTVIFFAGTDVSAKIVHEDMSTTTSNQTVTGIGFTPNVAFFTCTGQSAVGILADKILSFGCVANVGGTLTQCVTAHSAGDALATSNTNVITRDDAFVSVLDDNTVAENYHATASAFGSGTFTYACSSSAGSDDVACLFLDLGVASNDEIFLGMLSQPTVTGTWAETGVGFKADAVICMEGDRATTLNAVSTANPAGVCFLCADKNGNGSYQGIQAQHNQATSNCGGDSGISFWRTRAAASAISMETDGIPTLTSSGFTAEVNTTQGQANNYWLFAVQDQSWVPSTIYNGSINVPDIYVGSTAVAEAYVGTNKVFG